MPITPAPPRLDLLDHLFDVVGCDGGLIGEAANLGCHDREAPAVFAGLFRFDRRVQREQVGLIRDLGDGGDDLVDVAGLLVEDRELRVDRAGRFHHEAHGVFHAREPA
jgi:hypothetical protein